MSLPRDERRLVVGRTRYAKSSRKRNDVRLVERFTPSAPVYAQRTGLHLSSVIQSVAVPHPTNATADLPRHGQHLPLL